MLKNFEEYTYDLTAWEAGECASIVLEELRGHYLPLNNNELAAAVLRRTEKKVLPARIRKVISYLRVIHAPHICADKNGYYLARRRSELEDYLISAKQRIRQQQAAVDAAESCLARPAFWEARGVTLKDE